MCQHKEMCQWQARGKYTQLVNQLQPINKTSFNDVTYAILRVGALMTSILKTRKMNTTKMLTQYHLISCNKMNTKTPYYAGISNHFEKLYFEFDVMATAVFCHESLLFHTGTEGADKCTHI